HPRESDHHRRCRTDPVRTRRGAHRLRHRRLSRQTSTQPSTQPTVTTGVDDSVPIHNTCGNLGSPRTRKDAHDAESPAARRQPAATDAAELPCGIRAPAALRFPTALRFAAALRLAATLRIPAALRLATTLRIPATLRLATLRFPTVLWATAELPGLARRPRSGSRPGAVRLPAAAAAG